MTKFIVMSRDGVEAHLSVLDIKYAIVSFCDPNLDYAMVPGRRQLLGMLPLKFDDVTSNKVGQRMTMQQATKVVKFVQEMLRDGADYIICQCEAGISRSSGAALALSELYGMDTKHFHGALYRPNPFVRKLILRAGRQLAAAS